MDTSNPYDLSHVARLTKWLKEKRQGKHMPFPFVQYAQKTPLAKTQTDSVPSKAKNTSYIKTEAGDKEA